MRAIYWSIAAMFPMMGILLLLTTSAEPSSSASNSADFAAASIGDATAYAWAPKGGSLAYATSDGTLWSVNGPRFGAPIRIATVALPKERQIEQIVWSPDGRNIALVSPRPSYLWDTIWLVDTKTSELRDLLPVGSPFGSPGIRALRISTWLPDGRIAFFLHCGTGCLGLHAVQTRIDDAYWDFCDSSGSFFWSPTLGYAVVQNDAEGIGPAGLGLVSALDGVAVATGASYYRARRECRSVFKGAVRCGTCGPSQAEPYFNSWFPDNRTVLYSDSGLNTSELKLWDTVSGSRSTLVDGAWSGAVSPDGRYICFLSRRDGRTVTRTSKRVLLKVLDLRTKRIVSSTEIAAAAPPIQWSPSSSYLAVLDNDGKLLLAHLTPGGNEVREMKLGETDTYHELSWSPDSRYLADWNEASVLKILSFR